MPRRTVLAVSGWLVAAVAATVTGLAAVQVIGSGLTGPAGEVRDPDEVARALAAPAPSAPGTPVAPGPAPSSALASRRVLSPPGGTVVAQCEGRNVWLISWTPAQGYRVHDVEPGPDHDVELTFAGSGGAFEVEVRCPAGEPVPSWKRDDD